MFTDEARQIREAGADDAYLTMNETGVALASHILNKSPVTGKHPDASGVG